MWLGVADVGNNCLELLEHDDRKKQANFQLLLLMFLKLLQTMPLSSALRADCSHCLPPWYASAKKVFLYILTPS